MLMPKLLEIIRRRQQTQFALPPTILLHQHIDRFDSPRAKQRLMFFLSKPIEQTPASRNRNTYT